MQGIEFLAQDYPGVVVGLDENKRIVFIGGKEASVVSGQLTAGEYLDPYNPAPLMEELGRFVDRIVADESESAGSFESATDAGLIIWKGLFHDDSGNIVLKGRVRSRSNDYDGAGGAGPQDKEKILETLLSNLPGMAYRCKNDVEWTMDFVSEGCFELTGYKPESLLANRDISYSDLILPQYQAHVWECVQEAVQDREPFEIIYKIRIASGEEKWVWEKGVDSRDEEGRGTLEGFITDVTPLMEAEQALHQSEERYRLMAEKTGQMVYDLNLETGKIIWSGAVLEITGLQEHEFQSVDLVGWEDKIHPDDRKEVIEELENCIREGAPFVSVYRFRRKNGSYLYVEDEGSFLMDGNGIPVRMVGVLRDYSHKMKVQELMIQTEKMTTVASLSAGMAHEINNPLGIVTQSAQNIERRLSPELPGNIETAKKLGISLESIRNYLEERKILTMVEEIKEAGSRAAKVIVNMLNFSRKSGDEKDFCSIPEIVERAIDTADAKLCTEEGCDFRKINFVKEFQEGLPHVLCYAGELEQVLLNLMRNSAQSIIGSGRADSKAEIVIRGYCNNAYLTIEVEDNGPGMDRFTRKKAFEPFFSTRAEGGSGLGLSVAYFIITRNHGGTIRIDSEPDKGTKFTLQLPRGPVSDIFSQGLV
ncbi:PAS domain S-box protein [Desulfovibrio sp. JC022]|nr:PAS domain-containing sensor histidine kinase [Desulfovibrio sp. JC022]NDV22976.1 PAS domain S-box protein [Desulfovibrio sp. JC022]